NRPRTSRSNSRDATGVVGSHNAHRSSANSSKVSSPVFRSGSGITVEQMTRMEREMEGLQQQFKTVEAAYGDDVPHLVIASGYLSKLLRNRKIEQHLDRFHPELVAEFRAIISAVSLDQPGREQGIA